MENIVIREFDKQSSSHAVPVSKSGRHGQPHKPRQKMNTSTDTETVNEQHSSTVFKTIF